MTTAEPYILFVDDDDDDREMIRLCCEELDMALHVRFLTSGEALFSFLAQLRDQQEYPSLLVLDVNMPRLGGEEVLVRLKADPLYKHLPVVMFSTSNCRDNYYLALGAEACYQKPNTYPELQQQVATFFRRLNTPVVL
ncbi:MAG TPA: response regulator [Flavisolibacter sp.]|nr:response regulator [Flavisolibacter sp.]